MSYKGHHHYLVKCDWNAVAVMSVLSSQAYPQAVTYWSMANGPNIIVSNAKYDASVSNIPSLMYKSFMRLRIRELEKTDLGSYSCLAKNSMGETKGTIQVDEGPPSHPERFYTTTTTSSSPNSWNDNEGGHSSKRSKYLHTKTDKDIRKYFLLRNVLSRKSEVLLFVTT